MKKEDFFNYLKKIGKIPNIEMKYEQKKRDLFAKI
jgi:hypothetical protein